MRRAFIDFVDQPTKKSFELLRRELLAQPGYDPYDTTLSEFQRLCEAGQCEEARAIISSLQPGCVLSPRARRLSAWLSEMAGEHRLAERKRQLTKLVVQFLLDSGDGSLEHPYQIIHPEDEYDILQERGLSCDVERKLIRDRGRLLDCFEIDDDRSVFFEVTELQRAHLRTLGDQQAA